MLRLGLEDCGFMVMLGAAMLFYLGSKFNVIAPRRGYLYPVSRRLLLQACWRAQLQRMLGLGAMWGVMLWVFCAGFRWLYPSAFGDMPSYYPLAMAASGVLPPMPVAQWFAVHYGGNFNKQSATADRKFLRSLVFIGSEILNMGALVWLMLAVLIMPPLKTLAVLLLVLVLTQGVLFLGMRSDMLRGDLA
jgi:hypothetical protein